MKRLMLFALPAALLWAVPGSGADGDAEPPPPILHMLAQYPKEVRESILELAGHPAVLKQLEPDLKGPALDKVIGKQPAAVQKAAKTVLEEPDVLKLLKDDPEYYAEVGKKYVVDRAKVGAQMDEEEKSDGKATDEWTARLEDDQEAFDQLTQAQAAFAKAPGGAIEDAGISGSGANINVHTLPTPNFVSYVMANADKYPSLANTMTSQWLSSRNPPAFDSAYHNWWHDREGHFHDSLLKPDANRADRLGELAKFDRAHPGEDAAKRYNNFDRHHRDNPNLAKLPKHDPNHKPLARHQKPNHKDPHAAGKNPHKRPHKGEHHHAHHKPPSHKHHMHHAKAAHHHHAHHHHHGGKHKK